MNRLLILLCGSLIGLAATAGPTDDSYPDAFDQKPVGRFLPSTSEYFGPLAPAAKLLVLTEKQNGSIQHFCTVGYRYADGAMNVWVHWQEGRRLILWRGDSEPDTREKGLVSTNRYLKLGKDTVERQDALNGSTFMETRAWWEGVASDCDAHGEKLVLTPFSSDSR